MYDSTVSNKVYREDNSFATLSMFIGSVITPTRFPRDLYSRSPIAIAIRYDGILILFSN